MRIAIISVLSAQISVPAVLGTLICADKTLIKKEAAFLGAVDRRKPVASKASSLPRIAIEDPALFAAQAFANSVRWDQTFSNALMYWPINSGDSP